MFAAMLMLFCLGCTGEKRLAGSDSASAASIAAAGSSDSLTQATAADLEQILFSQDAPPGFPQEYWALGRRIYDGRRYAPLWTGPEATSDKRRVRMGLLCRAEDEGIVLMPPFAAAPVKVPAFSRRVDSLARRDLELTFALVRYLTIVARGSVTPLATGAAWNVAPPAEPSDATLAALVETADSASIARLMPASPQYMLLSGAFRQLLDIDSRGGWSNLADSTLLRSGSRGAPVERLRKRLVLTGDMPAADSTGADYTSAVVSGVRNFQRRVGLDADGRVGPATRAALDVAAHDRARIVATNMERYRWIPRNPATQAVILDVASGTGRVSRNGALILSTSIHATSSCATRVPPLIADTIERIAATDDVLKMHLAAGDSVMIRAAESAASHPNAAACLIAEDFAALRSVLAPGASMNVPETELYLIWPTAYVAPDSALMFRHDKTDADVRLGAALVIPATNHSAICDSVSEAR